MMEKVASQVRREVIEDADKLSRVAHDSYSSQKIIKR